jgi:hypothetical protein
MAHNTTFIGLDTHKETIALLISMGDEPFQKRFQGMRAEP